MEKHRILFYGDSNTYGYDPADMQEGRYAEEIRWTDRLRLSLGEGWEILDEGQNGRTIPDMRTDNPYLEGLLSGLKDGEIFAFMLGTNDILRTYPPDISVPVGRMEAFLDFLRQRKAAQDLLLIAPPYSGRENGRDLPAQYYKACRQMNKAFEKLARQRKIPYVNADSWHISLAFDEVHFSEEGHRQFADAMREYLLQSKHIRNT